MYCTKCGAQVPDGAKFCPKCGAPVAVTSQKAAADNISQNAGTDAEKARAPYQNKVKSRNKKAGIAAAIIAAALIVIIIIVQAASRNPVREAKNVINNLIEVANGNYSDISDAIDDLAPKSIAGDLADMYDIASRSSTMHSLYNPEEDSSGSNYKLEKVTIEDQLDDNALSSYQQRINYLGSHLNFLGTGGYTATLLQYALNLSEKDANKFEKDMENIRDYLSNAEVSNGYAVSFTYTVDDEEHEDQIDVIRVDGDWVAAPYSSSTFGDWSNFLLR